jgi:hypothetical protein
MLVLVGIAFVVCGVLLAAGIVGSR